MKHLALALVGVLLAGCGNFNSIHRDFDVNSGVGALVDIKQRAIIVARNPVTETVSRDQVTGAYSTKKEGQIIVCAEPSPDALSAYVAEFAAKGELPNGIAGQLSGGTSEGAAFTGLRTYGIQVLRDAMYQNCQAHMNKALSSEDYGILARRNQRYMVALLAIEQLTGAVKAPPVVITTTGKAEAARSLSEMQSETSVIDGKVDELKAKLGTGVSDEEKKTIQDELAALAKNKQAIQAGIANARSVLTSQGTAAQFSNIGMTSPADKEAISSVAGTVKDIVKEIFTSSDDKGQVCLGQIVALSAKKPHELTDQQNKLLDTCHEILKAKSGPLLSHQFTMPEGTLNPLVKRVPE